MRLLCVQVLVVSHAAIVNRHPQYSFYEALLSILVTISLAGQNKVNALRIPALALAT